MAVQARLSITRWVHVLEILMVKTFEAPNCSSLEHQLARYHQTVELSCFGRSLLLAVEQKHVEFLYPWRCCKRHPSIINTCLVQFRVTEIQAKGRGTPWTGRQSIARPQIDKQPRTLTLNRQFRTRY